MSTIIFLIPKLMHLVHLFCTSVDNHMSGILYADDRVPTELKKAIMQARMDKKLTQSQLAQVLFSPPNLSLFMFFISRYMLSITIMVTCRSLMRSLK